MATGDPPVCTCPTVWAGIGEYPTCVFCLARRATTNTTAWIPGVSTTVFNTHLIRNDSTNVEAATRKLAETIGARIGANGIDKANAAAFDAWQLVLAQLQVLREAVQRAVEAEAAT